MNKVVFTQHNTAIIEQHTKRAESCVVKDMAMYCSLFQGATLLGQPDAIVDLGNTEVPKDIFTEYLSSLEESTYRQIHPLFLPLYILNHVSNDVLMFQQSFSRQNQKKLFFSSSFLSTVQRPTTFLTTTVTLSAVSWPSF